MTRLLFFLFAISFFSACTAQDTEQKSEPKPGPKNEAQHESKTGPKTGPNAGPKTKPTTGAKPGRPPAIVVTESAVQESIAPTAFYSATVISRDDANLSAELAGRITWVAEVGDRVQAGDSVVKLVVG